MIMCSGHVIKLQLQYINHLTGHGFLTLWFWYSIPCSSRENCLCGNTNFELCLPWTTTKKEHLWASQSCHSRHSWFSRKKVKITYKWLDTSCIFHAWVLLIHLNLTISLWKNSQNFHNRFIIIAPKSGTLLQGYKLHRVAIFLTMGSIRLREVGE